MSQLSAILSLYYHARAAREDPPQGIVVLAMVDAATTLRSERSPSAEFWRRRCIAKLAAADVDRDDHVAALGVLLRDVAPPTLDDIRAALDGRPDLDLPGRETLISNLQHDALGPEFAGCPTRNLRTVVACRPLGATKATTTLEVRLEIPRVARALDPQRWDDCSVFFDKAYVARQSGGTYPIDANYDAYAHPDPPTSGTTWRDVVFEHFTMRWNGAESSFAKTLLDVASRRGDEGYAFTYDLRHSIRSGVMGVHKDGGIRVDRGQVAARRSGDWVTLEAVKVIEFSDRVLNEWACVLLPAMGDEVAKNVCCEP